MEKYRLGKRTKRAIIESETGHEYVVFPEGKEEQAAKFLEFLNGGYIRDIYFYMTCIGCVISVVLMALIFTVFINREMLEKDKWRDKYEKAISLPIYKEK